MSVTPSGGAGEQLARLLTLVPYLHTHGTIRLAEAAAALDVTPAQLLGDLKVLWMCGLPGGYPDDLIDVDMGALESEDGEALADGVIRVSNADYLNRPLRLTATEATAIIVALRALRAGAVPGQTPGPQTVAAIDSALAALEVAAASATDVDPSDEPRRGKRRTDVEAAGSPGSPVDRVLIGADPGADDPGRSARIAELTRSLTEAIEQQRRVRLDYYVPSRDELSTRLVDPHRVVEHDGHAYLDAWCHSAEAPRLFRLDRIDALEVTQEAVSTEPASRDLSAGFFTPDQDLTRVTLRLRPQAQWIVDYYPVLEVRAAPEGEGPGSPGSPGSLDVDLLVADERWLTKLLLRLAPNAFVVSPTSMSQAFITAAQAALDLYPIDGGLPSRKI